MAVARRASRRARTGGAELGSRLPLVIVTIVVAAITFDMLAGEHPTHTVALALVALAVAGLRLRLSGQREGLVSVVSGAVVAQPALHATAKLDTAPRTTCPADCCTFSSRTARAPRCSSPCRQSQARFRRGEPAAVDRQLVAVG
jgi:hypothetical protein